MHTRIAIVTALSWTIVLACCGPAGPAAAPTPAPASAPSAPPGPGAEVMAYVNGQAIVVDGGLSSSHPVGSRRS